MKKAVANQIKRHVDGFLKILMFTYLVYFKKDEMKYM